MTTAVSHIVIVGRCRVCGCRVLHALAEPAEEARIRERLRREHGDRLRFPLATHPVDSVPPLDECRHRCPTITEGPDEHRPQSRRAPGRPRHGQPARNRRSPTHPGLGGWRQEIVDTETSFLRRLSPRRNKWPKLDEFDDRVQALAERQAAITADLAHLKQQLQTAPAKDIERRAAWLEHGDGERPTPDAPRIEQQIVDRSADQQALQRLIEQTLKDKAAYVDRHRDTFVGEAQQAVDAAHRHVNDLLDQLAAAREELAAVRGDHLWAALYPDQLAGLGVHNRQFAACGLPSATKPLGLKHAIDIARVWELLRTDANAVATVVSGEQSAQLTGHDPRRKKDAAYWANSPEAAEQHKRDRKTAIANLSRGTGWED